MAGTVEGGAAAPDFMLPATGGDIALASLRGRKVVLFFYPKADTPGCTQEALDFSRLRPDFEACKTTVAGISADPLKAQEKFRAKHGLDVPLASDPEHGMLEAYGVWAEKSMYGRTFMGIVRSTFLIDSRGRIARVWRNVKVPGHADEVLAAAKAL